MAEVGSKTELAVIGGGPGGYAAAFLAADLGMQVTLIDPGENPGGVCLYRGCIPSKALLHVAKLIGEAREASNWGVSFAEPSIDINKLRSWKEGVVDKLTGGLGQLNKRRKISHVRGMARFVDAHTVEISGANNGQHRLQLEHAIVATGSLPASIPGVPSGSEHFWDSTAALALPEIPKSLLVVGGGYIGLELGSVYSALGSRVTVVEMTNSLLPGVDGDLVRPLAKRLQTQFEDILLSTKVERFEEHESGVKAHFAGESLESPERNFDKVLISVGRKPNANNVGLENTRVKINESGFVEVDQQLRTAEPNIFAIGDIVGQPMLAHKASHEGRTAVEVISGRDVVFQPRAIPAVVFTDPEVAWCGMTENEAKQSEREIEVARFPWAASGRALTMDRPEGMTKLIIDKETERVLGVGLVGSGAGELISEGVLAVEMSAEATDVKLSIHPHPTLSETVMESAEVFFGQSTHVYRPKRR